MTNDNVTYIYQEQDEAEAAFAALVASKGGGDDGGSGMLDQRVGRLEGQMDKVISELSDIKVTMARIDAKLDSKPSHWGVILLNAALLGLVIAAIGFGMTVSWP